MAGVTDPGIGTKIIVHSLAIPILLFYSLLLAGCASESPGLPSIHLAELHRGTQPVIRIGYYSFCVQDSKAITCVSTAFTSDETIKFRVRNNWGGAALADRTIQEAIDLQTKAFINVLAIGLVLFALSLPLELIRVFSTKRTRKVRMTPATKRRQNFYRHVGLGLAWGACTFTFAAAVANTQSGHALEISADGGVSLGPISCGLHWTIWALSLIHSVGWTMTLRTKSGVAHNSAQNGSALDPGFGSAQPLTSNPAPMGGVITI